MNRFLIVIYKIYVAEIANSNFLYISLIRIIIYPVLEIIFPVIILREFAHNTL